MNDENTQAFQNIQEQISESEEKEIVNLAGFQVTKAEFGVFEKISGRYAYSVVDTSRTAEIDNSSL